MTKAIGSAAATVRYISFGNALASSSMASLVFKGVVRFHQHGGPEVLHIDDIEVRSPGVGEVRIQVKAIGLNRAEALMRAGRYIETPQLPSRLGLEASGIVETMGEGVSGIALGDAVSVIPPISMIRYPAHGKLAIFPAAHIVMHPPSLGWQEAAALWMPFLTAYGALIDIAQLQPAAPSCARGHSGPHAAGGSQSVHPRRIGLRRLQAGDREDIRI
jgi:NADPH:quinone reductase-like Zn-dependent oxidoreductase